MIECKNWLDNGLPAKCAKLIIMDPPYFKVKGAFDFVWKTFDDYLVDVELWAIECQRVLADNGTLLWYGDRKKIAYTQIILDKFFNLEATMVIEFINKQTRKNRPEDIRTFTNVTERLLMYSACPPGISPNGGDIDDRVRYLEGKLKARLMEPLIGYLVQEMQQAGHTPSSVNKALKTYMASHWLARTSQWSLPNEKDYARLRRLFNGALRREYEELRREYEELRREYEELRRYFHPPEEFKTDVLRVSQEAHITQHHDHDTVKPEGLTRTLIGSTTRPGDLVVVPMSGSGTECAMAAELGRPFRGFDIKQKYVDMSNDRANKILSKPKLFYT